MQPNWDEVLPEKVDQATSALVTFANSEPGAVYNNPPVSAPRGTDLLDYLPEPSRGTMRTLYAKLSDLRTIARSTADDSYEALQARRDAERNVQRLEDWSRRSQRRDPASIEQATAVATRAAEEASRCRDRADAALARADHLARLVANVEAWLRAQYPAELRPLERHAPKLGKGETVIAAIERIRSGAAKVKAELHAVRSAPFPSSTVKARVRDEIEALAQQGRPDVFPMIERREATIGWPMTETTSPVAAAVAAQTAVPGLALHKEPNSLAVTCWLFKKQLLHALESDVDGLANDAAALSDEERSAREKRLLAKLLSAEHDEEGFIRLAEQQGMEIQRRPDADPRAILGLSG